MRGRARAEAQAQPCRSRLAFLLALRQRDEPFRGEGEALRRGVEVLAGGEAAVVHDPADQVKTGLRRRRPLGEDVALPIGHHRHLGGRRQHALGLFGGGDQAMGFLVLGAPLLVGDLDPAAARPDVPCDEAEAAAGAGIERQHGVQQHAAAAALADLAEPAPALRRGAEIEFAGVVDGQDVPPRDRHRRLLAPAFDQARGRHLGVGQKSSEADLRRASPARQSPQAHARTRDHAAEQRRPLLSRRRSPNRPNCKFRSDIATPRFDQSVTSRIMRLTGKGTPKMGPSHSVAPSAKVTEMCASPSRERERGPEALP